jgi:hypothetical protein
MRLLLTWTWHHTWLAWHSKPLLLLLLLHLMLVLLLQRHLLLLLTRLRLLPHHRSWVLPLCPSLEACVGHATLLCYLGLCTWTWTWGTNRLLCRLLSHRAGW